MGSLKSKLFTIDNDNNLIEKQSVQPLEQPQQQSFINRNNFKNRSLQRNNNKYIKSENKSSSSVNNIPKSHYFRSLRANTKKQITSMQNKSSTSSKLFGTVSNILRSKSNTDMTRPKYRSSVGRKSTQKQEEIINNENKETVSIITQQLKSTSLTKNDEESTILNNNNNNNNDNNDDKNNNDKILVISSNKDTKEEKNNENEKLGNDDGVISINSDSTSNIYYTEDDNEWEIKNRHNDDLIEDLKKQVESLNNQLTAIGKEDFKLINELTNKIENLSKMNETIITNIEIQSQRQEQKNIYKKQREYQKTRLLDEYHNRLRQQNEVLLNQQSQINELKTHLYNASTLLQNSNNNNNNNTNIPYTQSFTESYYATHASQGIYAPHSTYYYQNVQPSTSHYHTHTPTYYYTTLNQYEENQIDDNPSYYLYYRQKKPKSYYRSSRRNYHNYNNSSKLYYDASTGCYYYHEFVPTTIQNDSIPNYYYHQHTQNQPNIYVYTQYSNLTNNNEDTTDNQGVIITEIDDDDDDIAENKTSKENISNTKNKEYIDAISINE